MNITARGRSCYKIGVQEPSFRIYGFKAKLGGTQEVFFQYEQNKHALTTYYKGFIADSINMLKRPFKTVPILRRSKMYNKTPFLLENLN